MKHFLLVIMFATLAIGCNGSLCNTNHSHINKTDSIEQNNSEEKMKSIKISIKVGSKIFTATLLDNKSGQAFKEMLPISINMDELNGNEKYYDLAGSLPANSVNPQTIQSGDLMLYGSKTLVLFYKSFSTSYSYTSVGRIDDSSRLAAALGSGSVSVTFEKK